jgi:hypothetical protein
MAKKIAAKNPSEATSIRDQQHRPNLPQTLAGKSRKISKSTQKHQRINHKPWKNETLIVESDQSNTGTGSKTDEIEIRANPQLVRKKFPNRSGEKIESQ